MCHKVKFESWHERPGPGGVCCATQQNTHTPAPIVCQQLQIAHNAHVKLLITAELFRDNCCMFLFGDAWHSAQTHRALLGHHTAAHIRNSLAEYKLTTAAIYTTRR